MEVDEAGGFREVEATLTAEPTTASPTATGIPLHRPLQQLQARAPILAQGETAVADEAALCGAEDAAVEAGRPAFETDWDLVSSPSQSCTPLSSEFC